MRRFPPERIVCLTGETVETFYLLGEEDRIVEVSGYSPDPQRSLKADAILAALRHP
jgi:iron complex transport system substrate-binding protein